jgi:cobalamin biosynthesis Co2+ chelatase CbiK
MGDKYEKFMEGVTNYHTFLSRTINEIKAHMDTIEKIKCMEDSHFNDYNKGMLVGARIALNGYYAILLGESLKAINPEGYEKAKDYVDRVNEAFQTLSMDRYLMGGMDEAFDESGGLES